MSDPRTEQQPPLDGEDSDFGSRLKVRLAIAGVLVALALAAIPVLDSLTGKKQDTQDSSSNAGNIAGLAANQNASAAVAAASAPVADASAAAASQPASSAPAGPNLSQTPGMTAAPPLSLPPVEAETPAAAPRSTSKAHSGHVAPPAVQPLTAQPPVRSASKALRPGAPAPLSAAPYNQRPANNGGFPAAQPLPPVQAQAPATASLGARPAGSSVGYNVQLGLFNNLDNAQKLIAELKSKGIEVQSETRVHLAPFRTRAEAEQAVAKLRAMGYAPMLGAANN